MAKSAETSPTRILIVEDDPAIAGVLRDNFEYEGYRVDTAPDGNAALEKTSSFGPDLVLLDLMIPGIDGFDVCRRLSEGARRIPIIILSARSQKEDKIRGLELGADDYVTKPFTFDELLARVHAVLRRATPSLERLVLGTAVIDFRQRSAKHGRNDLQLTHRDFELLKYLGERAGQVVSREELIEGVWGRNTTTQSRAVDTLVVRLRKKIEVDPRHPNYLQTAYGDGYRLVVD